MNSVPVAFAAPDNIGAIGALEKKATSLRAAGDMQSALRCLSEAFEMRKSNGFGIEAKPWTKYPLYLQKAGDVATAIVVFDWVIQNAEALVSKAPEMSDQPPFVIAWAVARFRSEIHDKYRLCCMRSSLQDEAMQQAERLDKSLDEEERLSKLVAMHRERMREKARQRRAALANSRT